ncbi:MAG TPA: hypothetical protein ENJ88_09325 [Phaeodactylibacter sp.]|nr:hypothetical protein [Phaeodactylibacter sp.]
MRTKWIAFFACWLGVAAGMTAQTTTDSTFIPNSPFPASGLAIGAYAQLDYNQPVGKSTYETGTLDAHRLVTTLAYRYNARLRFMSEIEVEHGSEIFIEQAWMSWKFHEALRFKAGVLLVPMGIINEYHEPPTYSGVERPLLDTYLVPSTWREMGAGFTGRLPVASLNYQIYVLNGFASYKDGQGLLKASSGLRKGRQKAIESFVHNPALSAKLSYYGLPGLEWSASLYAGKTQSDLFSGLDRRDAKAVARADSSVIGTLMLGTAVRFKKGRWNLRAQYIYARLSHTEAYNAFTGAELGSLMQGYYLEAAAEFFRDPAKGRALVPFVRYEFYDTNSKTDSHNPNPAYKRHAWFVGAAWKFNTGMALKLDYRWQQSALDSQWNQMLNAGVGVWF